MRKPAATFESPFEQAVGEALSNAGWQVRPQVGVSGYRIDLGIVHPDKPGAYLAGIECDGATYHRAATARDRDKVREQVLRNLGWTILRIWSPDWWYDADTVRDRILAELTSLLEISRQEEAQPPSGGRSPRRCKAPSADGSQAPRRRSDGCGLRRRSPIHQRPTNQVPPTQNIRRRGMDANGDDHDVFQLVASGLGAAHQQMAADVPLFRIADLSGFRADADQFFEFRYRQTLRDMVEVVMAAEAPIREDVLAKRIARAHGWLRTGSRIRNQIALHLRDLDATDEKTGRFLWPKGSVKDFDRLSAARE